MTEGAYCPNCGRTIVPGDVFWRRGNVVTHPYATCMQFLREDLDAARRETRRIVSLLNAPETEDFDRGVPLEAAHQVQRWGAESDAGKSHSDWFWLLGYLAGKALAAASNGDLEKAKHHCVSSAAVLRNWHAHLRSGSSLMRPGIAAVRG